MCAVSISRGHVLASTRIEQAVTNCRDNLLHALKMADIALAVVPDPVNFFQRSEPQPDGRLEVLASDNPPGGNVLLRAETNLYVVVTACSVDFHPTNGGRCTGIEITVG